MTIAAVVLAAGAGSRFAGPEHKLRTLFRGRPILCWVLEAVDQAGFDQTYVITGAHDVDDLVGEEVTIVANPDWAEGQSTSLGVAVDAVAADGHDAFVVGLGDQPLVPASAWRSVGASAGEIVTATFDGKRRPPVKLSRSVWTMLDRTGDAGARPLMERRRELVSEIPCTGNPVDIDTLEDLQQWS
ncbi:MAG: nucleotidyltransferase family protein [Actinomycetia bacterium]|nr:nucleotidyltransferase family protein [Actinomycetes bacterium]MCP4226982.1 nucleotidyltransferase family protein [Actinomycetes bacterium]MCP5035351.1 nucleotidyltransferase family protein [Actinomycetes bacterium]